jgi:hypothetical protein
MQSTLVFSNRSAGVAYPTKKNGSSVYFALSLTIIMVVVFGFGRTINSALIHAPSPRPWILYAHIALFTAWIALFTSQTALIRSKRVIWHRRLGRVGIFLGALMPFVAIGAVFAMKRLHAAEGHIASTTSLVVPFFDMLSFSISLGLAIRWRRLPEYHRRLMLIATCAITSAAFARFPSWLIPDNCFYLGVDTLILAAIAWEWFETRNVHAVYRYGLPALVTGQAVTMCIFL